MSVFRPVLRAVETVPMRVPFGDVPANTSQSSSSANVYVDSQTGSDLNSGLSPSQPLQTLAAAEAWLVTTLQTSPEAQISLAAGSLWRESLDLSAYDNITVAGYGDLTAGLPIIAGDDVAQSWQDSADRSDGNTNVYTTSATLIIPAGNTYPNVWEDDFRLTRVYSMAACQSTAGTFYVAATGANAYTNTSAITYAVHPQGSTNAKTDGKTYEVTIRKTVLGLGDGCTVRHVHARRAGHNSGPIWGGHDCLIDRCIAEDGYRHAMLLESGEQRDSVGWMQTFDPNAGYIVNEFYTETDIPPGTTVTWRRTAGVLERIPSGETVAQVFGGHGPAGTATTYQHVICEDCAAVNGYVSFDDCDALTITRANLKDASVLAVADTTVTDTRAEITTGSFLGNGIMYAGISATSLTVIGLRAYINGDLPGSLNPVFRRQSGTAAITIERSAVYFGPVVDTGAAAYVTYIAGSGPVTITGTAIDTSDAPVRGQFLRVTSQNEPTFFAGYTGTGNAYNPGGARARTSGGFDEDAGYIVANYETGSAVVADLGFADPGNDDWTISGSGVPANVGLERPNISYLEPPASLADAVQWILDRG